MRKNFGRKIIKRSDKFQFIGQLNQVLLHPSSLQILPTTTSQRRRFSYEAAPFHLCSGVRPKPWFSRFGCL